MKQLVHTEGHKSEDQTEKIVGALWGWYERWKRVLPWRDLAIQDDTQRAYMILVSEVMLQQTQVSRVKIVFKNFLEQFPTIADLAKATNRDVILAWRGMGYNSRALRLRDAAASIVEQYKGGFPREMEELLQIKGIGPYTAAAIRNFAFNEPTPCIDTNIRRILHRVFLGPEGQGSDGKPMWQKSDKQLIPLAENVMRIALETDTHDSSEWHAALMDFGSLVCRKSVPLCESCPLTVGGHCESAFRVKKLNKISIRAQNIKKEVGVEIAGKHVPNRILRGRVVELLRDEPGGLPLDMIGSHIRIDWEENMRDWLKNLLKKLCDDGLLKKRAHSYALKDR